jgi:hypothetical protein
MRRMRNSRLRTRRRMRRCNCLCLFSHHFFLHLCHTGVRMTAKRLLREIKMTKRVNPLMDVNGAAVVEEDHTSKFKPFSFVQSPMNPYPETSVATVVKHPHRNDSEDDEK